jgi:uncharacterized protein (TIRG00374 family)
MTTGAPNAGSTAWGLASRTAKFALLGLVFWWLSRQPWIHEFAEKLTLDLLVGALAVQPLVLISLMAQARRHAVLARTPPAPFWTAFRAVTLAQGLNVLVPGRLSEGLKATYLKQKAGVPLSDALAALVIERLLDLAILGAISVVVISSLIAPQLAWLPGVAASAAIAILIALPSFRNIALKVSGKVPWPRAAAFITRFQDHAASRLTTQHLTTAVQFGLVAWAASVVNVALFFAIASEPSLTLLQSLLVFVVTTFGGAVPALPGGFGTYEASAVFALQQFGFTVPEALALAVSLHVAQLILPLLATVYILAVDRVGVSELLRDLRELKRPRD